MVLAMISKTISTGKKGINFVRDVVDNNECFLNEIKQENDVGIDAFIEFTENQMPTGKCIAIQVKTGDSFINRKLNKCIIPISTHAEYWKNYSIPP